MEGIGGLELLALGEADDSDGGGGAKDGAISTMSPRPADPAKSNLVVWLLCSSSLPSALPRLVCLVLRNNAELTEPVACVRSRRDALQGQGRWRAAVLDVHHAATGRRPGRAHGRGGAAVQDGRLQVRGRRLVITCELQLTRVLLAAPSRRISTKLSRVQRTGTPSPCRAASRPRSASPPARPRCCSTSRRPLCAPSSPVSPLGSLYVHPPHPPARS